MDFKNLGPERVAEAILQIGETTTGEILTYELIRLIDEISLDKTNINPNLAVYQAGETAAYRKLLNLLHGSTPKTKIMKRNNYYGKVTNKNT